MDARDKAMLMGTMSAISAMLIALFVASRFGLYNWLVLSVWALVGPAASFCALFFCLRWLVARGALVRGVAAELLEKLAVFPLILWSVGIAGRVVFGYGEGALSRKPDFGEVALFLVCFVVLLALAMI